MSAYGHKRAFILIDLGIKYFITNFTDYASKVILFLVKFIAVDMYFLLLAKKKYVKF